MSYRSLTRVLGETRLERKCRWLFAGCILLLVGGAFLLVDRIAEDLVIKNTRNKGRDLVDMVLLKLHFERWQTDEAFQPLAKAMIEDFEKNQNYQHALLSLDHSQNILDIKPQLPVDQEEAKVLRAIRADWEKQKETQAAEKDTAKTKPDGQSSKEAAAAELLAEKITPVFKDRSLPGSDEYHYYEPIYWKSTCRSCHTPLGDVGAISASEDAGSSDVSSWFHVVKVVIPYKETENAINRARAILIAVAILTVFLGMIVLYAIVRYVIVRPLKHLRDVSDSISRGKTEMRADINTADEFQELADSFNRMVRHMTDAQDELKQVNANLDGKVDQLAQLNMQLHEMNNLKSDFLANMSHELRTPLNSIIGFSEVLQGIESLDDNQRRYAGNIQKSGRLLLEMINDILDLAKMEAGKMELKPAEFNGDTLVSAQCDLVRSLAEEKNIDLDVQTRSGETPLYQDQVKIQQILTNLLSNAIKFTPEGGRITVTTERRGKDRFVLTVADTGVGIAEEDREVVFEKFRQSKSVLGDDGGLTREYAGTGLGLSIVKELCKLLGGEIDFTSELGKGSTFVVSLPWHLPDPGEHHAQMSARLDDLTRPSTSLLKRPAADTPTEAASLAAGDD